MNQYDITFQTWNKLAQNYQDKFMDLDLYNDTYDLFCQYIEKPNAKVFEIGCGPGNITKYLLHKRADVEFEGIDVAPNMIELAQKNVPEAHFSVMDCRDIHHITAHYDGVICGFCLPYLSKEDCSKLIKDCANLLNLEGIIYLSCIEGAYDKSKLEKSSNGEHTMFVYIHQEDYLQMFLKTNNFIVLNVTRKAYPKADGTTDVHLILIAKKQ